MTYEVTDHGDLEPLNAEMIGPGCKWIIGDPRSPDAASCGREQLPGKPYCQAHYERAYVQTERHGKGGRAA